MSAGPPLPDEAPTAGVEPPVDGVAPLAGTGELRRWLLTEGRRLRSPGDLMAALSAQLMARGVPVARASLQLRILHPQYAGRSYTWWQGEGWHREDHVHRPQYNQEYRLSPVYSIHEGGPPLRRRLGPADPIDFPVLEHFRARGLTDYLALPLPMGDGAIEAVSWATDAASGFSDGALATLEALGPALAAVLELEVLRELSRTLLDTYLGRMTGGRVLDGSIARGDRDALRAVIWWADLRGFTELSELEPPAHLLSLLDDWFERVSGPIRVHGGEILKFIGDGILAIFPVTRPDDEPRVCRAALAAAHDARTRLLGLCSPAGLELRYGLAMHVGDVVYGNVGAPDRLDFTVVGADVNRTNRIERWCRELRRPVIVSEAFAAHVPDAVERLGEFPLKGLRGLQTLYGLRDAPPWADQNT
jgi:adenylate cyclase